MPLPPSWTTGGMTIITTRTMGAGGEVEVIGTTIFTTFIITTTRTGSGEIAAHLTGDRVIDPTGALIVPGIAIAPGGLEIVRIGGHAVQVIGATVLQDCSLIGPICTSDLVWKTGLSKTRESGLFALNGWRDVPGPRAETKTGSKRDRRMLEDRPWSDPASSPDPRSRCERTMSTPTSRGMFIDATIEGTGSSVKKGDGPTWRDPTVGRFADHPRRQVVLQDRK